MGITFFLLSTITGTLVAGYIVLQFNVAVERHSSRPHASKESNSELKRNRTLVIRRSHVSVFT
jgi:hypothetical protein